VKCLLAISLVNSIISQLHNVGGLPCEHELGSSIFIKILHNYVNVLSKGRLGRSHFAIEVLTCASLTDIPKANVICYHKSKKLSYQG